MSTLDLISIGSIANIIRAQIYERNGSWYAARIIWISEREKDHIKQIDHILKLNVRNGQLHMFLRDSIRLYRNGKITFAELSKISQNARKRIIAREGK
jgi:hypothetical protein